MHPKVSIIIPNYNNAKYLANAITSAAAQTYANTEIIIIDDKSTDDSVMIIKKLAAKDSRVKFEVLPENTGSPSAARNRGMDMSTGDFLMFLDSDDIMHPTAVESLLMIAQSLDADVAVGEFAKVPESFKIPKSAVFPRPTFDFSFHDKPEEFYNVLSNINLITIWGKLFRRETIRKFRFRTDIYPHEDVEFMIRLYSKVKMMAKSPCFALYYRESETSVIADKNRDTSGDILKTLESMAKLAKSKDVDAKYAAFVKQYAWWFLQDYIANVRINSKSLGKSAIGIGAIIRKILPTGIFDGLKLTWRQRISLRLMAM